MTAAARGDRRPVTPTVSPAGRPELRSFLELAAAWYRERGVCRARGHRLSKNYHLRGGLEASRRLEIERRYPRAYRPRTRGQGRGLHPDAPSRLGALRAELPLELDPDARALRLLRWYNRRPTAQLGRSPAVDQPRLTLCGHDSYRSTPPCEVG